MLIQHFLDLRARLTTYLSTHPHSIALYTARAAVHEKLGYPDLAAGDSYKALLLCDEASDDSGEYHDEALSSLSRFVAALARNAQDYTSEPLENLRGSVDVERVLEITSTSIPDVEEEDSMAVDAMEAEEQARTWAADIYSQTCRISLARNLTTIGCLRSAHDFVQQALRAQPTSAPALEQLERIRSAARKRQEGSEEFVFDAQTLPDKGIVRREVYPWNDFEADRNSDSALKLLNERMKAVAPDLKVRVTELPLLTGHSSTNNGEMATKEVQTVKQLGVFATRAFAPGEIILTERSLLTANSALHEPLCDACSAPLPALSTSTTSQQNPPSTNPEPTPCDTCFDTLFCSPLCATLAMTSYHPAVCGSDVEVVARDVPASEAADALYTLLLIRALAMGVTQECCPLELGEVRWIWGDFSPTPTPSSSTSLSHSASQSVDAADSNDEFQNHPHTLPFTFSSNILLPLHALEKMYLSPFTCPSLLSETWIHNTLFAKFRGTASGRVDAKGRPEVAAVHPMWCLANHSCDPGVGWSWAGEMRFLVGAGGRVWRRKKGKGNGLVDGVGGGDDEMEVLGHGEGKEETKEGRKGGIQAGEEILSHYVDVDLQVKERREWGAGALGGPCMCERCVWEAGEV